MNGVWLTLPPAGRLISSQRSGLILGCYRPLSDRGGSLTDTGAKKWELRVVIGGRRRQPHQQKDDEYTCAFRILVDSQQAISQTITGADEISAVMIAFDAIRNRLKEQLPTATWLGLSIEIAFPRAIPNVAGIDTYKEIEALADQHIEDKFKHL